MYIIWFSEGMYAYDCANNLDVVALKMEKYKADGWLGTLIAGKLYLDFSRQDSFEKSLMELIKKIQCIYDNKKIKIPTAPKPTDTSLVVKQHKKVTWFIKIIL